MKKLLIGVGVIAAALVIGGAAWVGMASNKATDEVKELTIYSGRSEEFIAPFFAQWEAQSGIKLNIRYGDSAELAAQILEEGSNSPADLFLSQDAGSLGAVAEAGLFTQLSAEIASAIPATYVAANRNWVGVTGRARVFAYAPDRVKVRPQSVTDLTKPEETMKLTAIVAPIKSVDFLPSTKEKIKPQSTPNGNPFKKSMVTFQGLSIKGNNNKGIQDATSKIKIAQPLPICFNSEIYLIPQNLLIVYPMT